MKIRIRTRWYGGVFGLFMLAAQLAPPHAESRMISPEGIVELKCSPSSLRLEGAHAYAQLVLTGVREDGSWMDVTRKVRLAVDCNLVSVDERGLVRPKADGKGELFFEVEGRSVEVPVEVRGQGVAAWPSFVRDVMPIFSRRGCNAGTCHGSAKGKNGFKLSLRGYDAAYDHFTITDELAGRRFNRSSPEKSLFLLKPTGAVPHEGGRVIHPAEPDYGVLRSWVAGGVELDADAARVAAIEMFPTDPTVAAAEVTQQFRVVATYTDGSRRDVTAHTFFETSDGEVAEVDKKGLATAMRRGEAAILARYEGRYAATRLFVMGDRSGFEWQEVPEHNDIDTLVYRRLREIATLPSDLCSDAEFLRRLHLDLTGRLPSSKAVTTFLRDRRDSRLKRDEVIDRLIGSPEFVEHWSNRWADLLQVNSKFLGKPGALALRDWIRDGIASNAPYDEFVRTLLTASGSTLENPPAAYFKVLREPDIAMENTTQLFLGTRFNCNKCHDHPFERWTKDQHWQLAGFFAQVDRKDVAGSKKMPARRGMKAKSPPAYEEVIGDAAKGEAVDPEGKQYEPGFPFDHEGQVPAKASRRVQLAEWLTDPKNPYFARSYVNRLWSYFFGIGLIEPVDDIRASNPPTFPALLDHLTKKFIAEGFDVRGTMRRICQSRVYQHSIQTNRWNEDDKVHFAHALARRLPAEILFDAVHQATGAKPRIPGVNPAMGATDLVDSSVKADDGFLDLFGRPARESSCECERDNSMSLGQALNLVNGPTVAAAIRAPDSHIAELVAYEKNPAAIVSDLYLRFLSRPPSPEETKEVSKSFDPGDIDNINALDPADHKAFTDRMLAWEKSIPAPVWETALPGTLKSDGGAEFAALKDGSVLVSGKNPDKDRYTVVLSTDLVGITGLRLEVLPDESLPAKGPGRNKGGNFVLAQVKVTAVPLRDPSKAVVAQLTGATADFSQKGWPVAQAIATSAKGWGVAPKFGQRHFAFFEAKQDLGAEGGTLLIVTMDQPHGSAHTIGRFRWSVTTSKRPVRYQGVPEAVLAILARPVGKRTDKQRAALHRYYMRTDKLAAEKIRLGAAQDLAWALANSSAFLFNR
ncbi:MAG: DUF1553 domain-containing protein [Planctomycetota bacterium]|jgi:hypothetical protein|nr:DUF1553 domain-containing protein [Planctomycetota bacterium]